MTKLLTFFLLACVVSACSFYVRPHTTFILENKSSYDILIEFYLKSKLLDSVAIKSGEAFSKRLQNDSGATTTPFRGDSDSLVIIFGNQRFIRQYCGGIPFYKNFDKCQFEKNIIDFATGVSDNNKLTGKRTQTITFDDSDFEKAEVIN